MLVRVVHLHLNLFEAQVMPLASNSLFDAHHDDSSDGDDTYIVLCNICTAYEYQNILP